MGEVRVPSRSIGVPLFSRVFQPRRHLSHPFFLSVGSLHFFRKYVTGKRQPSRCIPWISKTWSNFVENPTPWRVCCIPFDFVSLSCCISVASSTIYLGRSMLSKTGLDVWKMVYRRNRGHWVSRVARDSFFFSGINWSGCLLENLTRLIILLIIRSSTSRYLSPLKNLCKII